MELQTDTAPIETELLTEEGRAAWDRFVHGHPRASLYHLFGWQYILEKVYGHRTYYLLAKRKKIHLGNRLSDEDIVGVLPLIHLKHILFGNRLISMPFMDMGGILSNEQEAGEALLAKALKLGKELNVTDLELRHQKEQQWVSMTSGVRNGSHKTRMTIELSASPETLWKSFKSKLRSQIKRPTKAGLIATTGGAELVEPFYQVFGRNMRDLGSPVHSKKLMRQVMKVFDQQARIFLVYMGQVPIAASLCVGFRKTLFNPWASSLREYSRFSPNMLLYWSMLEYGCEQGYQLFDMGRSTPGEGTYRFKKQWGAAEEQLHWQHISLRPGGCEEIKEKPHFQKAVQCWQRMPVPLSNILGPKVRKYIGL